MFLLVATDRSEPASQRYCQQNMISDHSGNILSAKTQCLRGRSAGGADTGPAVSWSLDTVLTSHLPLHSRVSVPDISNKKQILLISAPFPAQDGWERGGDAPSSHFSPLCVQPTLNKGFNGGRVLAGHKGPRVLPGPASPASH